jgi:SEC-C motif
MLNCWSSGTSKTPARGPTSGKPVCSRPRVGASWLRSSMGLTAPNPVSHSPQLAVPFAVAPRIGCNDPCHCGSGRKYKRCGCYEQDESIRRQLRSPGLPPWILSSRGKLHQFEKYACQVFDLPELLAAQSDARRAPDIPTFDVVNSLFHSAVLRIPSLNALEGDLKESDFQKLLGHQPTARGETLQRRCGGERTGQATRAGPAEGPRTAGPSSGAQ